MLIVIAALAQAGLLAAQQASVFGRVRGLDGKPAADVRVAVASLDENGQVPLDLTLVRIGRTDSSGSFRLEGIPAGRYALIAGAVERPTYFPGTDDRVKAAVVILDASSGASPLDFELVTPTAVPRYGLMGLGAAPPLYPVWTRIIVEGGNFQPALIDGLVLTYTDTTGTTEVEATLSPLATGTTVRARWDAGVPKLWLSMKVPVHQDASFQLSLTDGDYKVDVKRSGDKANPGSGYYVKSIELGSTDLMKSRATVKGPNAGTMVLTIAPCTPAVLDRCN